MLAFIYIITKWDTSTIILTFQSIFFHSTTYFFGKLRRVIFSHTFKHRFKDDTFCTTAYCFSCRYNFNTVLFEYVFIMSRIITITGKTV